MCQPHVTRTEPTGRLRIRSMVLARIAFLALVPSGIAFHVDAAHAQRLTGIVVGDGSGTPVADALVALVDARGEAVSTMQTDTAGVFAFSVPAAEYSLHVERFGYRAYTSQQIALDDGETVSVEVRLGIDAVPLEPLRVTARSVSSRGRAQEFYERRNDPAVAGGYFLSREDFDRNPSRRTSTVLQTVPVISLVRAGSDPMFSDRYMVRLRGGTDMSGTCAPSIYVDGVRVHVTMEVTVDEFVDPSQLEGVEIYRAGVAPAVFATSNSCGVVAFWTRAPQQGGDDWGWKRLAIGFGGLAAMLVLLAR